MPYFSTVQVAYRDGSVPKNKKVILGFSGAMTKPAFTDSKGQATVEHESRGTANVYINGKNCGSFTAPGRTAVQI